MKKSFVAIIAIVLGIVIGFTACCLRCCNKNKFAVVDVPTIVSSSVQVNNLKKMQEAKTQEIQQWLQKVQTEVETEKDKTKQEELLKQYNIEFAQKKAAIIENYNQELKKIDKSINDTIASYAEQNGYKMVVAKTFTLYGGDDITDAIAKIVK